MQHPVLQLILSLGMGLYVIHLGRSTYRQPEAMRQRWFRQLPQREWALTLLEGCAVFWIFGGFYSYSQE